MYKLYCRSFQHVMKVSTLFLPWREPELAVGENSLSKLPGFIQKEGITHVLIVTDKGVAEAGLLDQLLQDLRVLQVEVAVYDKTVPNPTIDNVEEALQIYKANHCQGIIAFGGGSPIDCAKGVGARVARPRKTLPEMRGLLKVIKKMPALFVVPTTAGTGSEATLACVVSDSSTQEKYALMDTALIPHYAVLDPLLTVNLPKHITATTGMDALTHAVEAYIGKSNTKETEQWSIEAVKLIFNNLYGAYTDGSDLTARTNMQRAAYLAGKAFTRAYVGYVHAIAHTLSGFYNVPHGLANAIILPHVLDYYGNAAQRRLAMLADAAGICNPTNPDEQKAKAFIQAIRDLNERMEIPEKIDCVIDSDIPLMVERALKEANPLYPVPKILNGDDLKKLIATISE